MSKQSIVNLGVVALMFVSGFNLLGSSCSSQNQEVQQESKKSESWYNTSWVWVWLFLVWPVGVYGLIKRNSK